MAIYCPKMTNFAAMKHWWIAFLCLFAVACHDDIDLPPTPLKKVVVVYVIGENSLSGYAVDDLNEMRQATALIPDSCKLVVYFDNSRTEQQPQIISFDNKDGEKLVYQYRNDPISSDSASMQQALKVICDKFPAHHYGLVMWSHGSGWIPQQKAPRRTIGIDNGQNSMANTGAEMEVSTLANVLRKTKQRWDYVFFDACFMQGVEVAYELRDVVDWCIGSPAEIPGAGAPYHRIMVDMFQESDEAWRIAETYHNYYKSRDGLIISALKTSELEALAQATAPLMAKLDEYPATDGIQQYMVYISAGQWKPEYFDMGSAMGKWLSDEEYTAWRQALERAVPHQFSTERWISAFSAYFNPRIIDPEHIACLSTYIPIEGRALNDNYGQTAWWKRLRK